MELLYQFGVATCFTGWFASELQIAHLNSKAKHTCTVDKNTNESKPQ